MVWGWLRDGLVLVCFAGGGGGGGGGGVGSGWCRVCFGCVKGWWRVGLERV